MKTLTKEEKINFIHSVESIIESITIQFSEDVRYFISCQFALESDFGTSNLATSCNNICGMRYPYVRITTSVNSNSNGFACYKNIEDCVLDYMLCLNYHLIGVKECESVKCFTHFISIWYCPTRDYIKRIMSIYDEFEPFYNSYLKLNVYVNDNEK